mmetsp:Transcript_9860/g.27970  ORF Transcript_9860/g.27970 Transcript_9860/m.27970 type:complete len:345 (+) Transcript_9860:392-1426(+)
MIWPEFRAHNAVFSIRQCIGTGVALCTEAALRQVTAPGGASSWMPSVLGASPAMVLQCASALVRLAVVLAAAQLAAEVTRKMGNSEHRTTNAMPYPATASATDVQNTKVFYRQCQFHATTLALVGSSDFAFLPLYGLESAPFMMTLVRKGLASSLGYHAVYSTGLIIPYLVFTAAKKLEMVSLSLNGNLARMARVKGGHSHNAIWPAILLCHTVVTSALAATPTGAKVLLNLAHLATFIVTVQHFWEAKWMLLPTTKQEKDCNPAQGEEATAQQQDTKENHHAERQNQLAPANTNKKREQHKQQSNKQALLISTDPIVAFGVVALFGAIGTGIALDSRRIAGDL